VAGHDTVGRDTSGPTTDDAMTASKEELRVGTTQQERGRVRLRKYLTTEQVHQTVPVQREQARVEREPITDANLDAATSGPEISDEQLRKEQIDVQNEDTKGGRQERRRRR
jgi:stress response protein YsnF